MCADAVFDGGSGAGRGHRLPVSGSALPVAAVVDARYQHAR